MSAVAIPCPRATVHQPRWAALLLPWVLAICGGWFGDTAWAAPGPENTALVVNGDSWVSRAVAARYAQLREIPPQNVVELRDLPGTDIIDVETFRQKILRPVLETLEERGLAGQIDCVAYSADFPFGVDVRGDLRGIEVPRVITPRASITGLTYLYQGVLAKQPGYLSLSVNRYYRRVTGPKRGGGRRGENQKPDSAEREPPRFRVADSIGFRGAYGWDSDGQPRTAGEHPRYLLSTMLTVTSGRGISYAEAMEQLQRSAAADHTAPGGTIYFLENSDIRSTTRKWGFDSAIEALRSLGVQAEKMQGVLPQRKGDVAGACVGSASFNWPASGSRILPGAICEHLTSFGGVLSEGAGQTPLTAFLRHGAAGSSGTVTEPFAVQAKFPTPFLYVHYARGATLAEAFYQSVAGPYQLLIVGDPLCAPWAPRGEVAIAGIEPRATVEAETITVQPRLSKRDENLPPVDRWELYLDGRRVAVEPDGEPCRLDLESLPNGQHLLTAAAVCGPLELRCRGSVLFVVRRKGPTVALTAARPAVPWDSELAFEIRTSGGHRVQLRSAGRVLAEVSAPGSKREHTGPAAPPSDPPVTTPPGDWQTSLRVPARDLGPGSVVLQAAALNAQGKTVAVSECLSIEVQLPLAIAAPVRLPAQPDEGGEWISGVEVTTAEGKTQIVENTLRPQWLVDAGVKMGQGANIAAVIPAGDDALFQFQARSDRRLTMAINGQPWAEIPGDNRWHYLPLHLAQGWHALAVQVSRGHKTPHISLRLGVAGTFSLGAGQAQVLDRPPTYSPLE